MSGGVNMIKFTNSVEIAGPIEKIFAFLSNFENLPKWNYAVIKTKQTSNGPVHTGTEYWQEREFLGRKIIDTFKVTEYESNKKVAVKSTSGPFPFKLLYIFESFGETTKVTNFVELEARGIFRILTKFITPKVKTAVEKNLNQLKHLIESQ